MIEGGSNSGACFQFQKKSRQLSFSTFSIGSRFLFSEDFGIEFVEKVYSRSYYHFQGGDRIDSDAPVLNH